MKKAQSLLAAATLAVSSIASSAFAGNVDSVKAFYDLLSNPGSETHTAAFVEATSDTWESVGNYSGKNKNRDAFLGQMGGFAQLLPDLNWDIQDMHEAGDFVTVRSRATGTPVAPFFGVDGEGRSFDILTIDIHEFSDGKIVRTFHVEDWAGAMQQLSGQ